MLLWLMNLDFAGGSGEQPAKPIKTLRSRPESKTIYAKSENKTLHARPENRTLR